MALETALFFDIVQIPILAMRSDRTVRRQTSHNAHTRDSRLSRSIWVVVRNTTISRRIDVLFVTVRQCNED